MSLFQSWASLAIVLISLGVSGGQAAKAQDTDSSNTIPGTTFGDWIVACSAGEDDKIGCGMTQVALNEENNRRVLRLDIRHIPSKHETAIQFIFPLGVALSFSPQLYLDDKFIRRIPIDLCLSDGCYSTLTLSDDEVEPFLRMRSGNLQIQSGSGHMVSLPISGTGSRAAFNAILANAND